MSNHILQLTICAIAPLFVIANPAAAQPSGATGQETTSALVAKAMSLSVKKDFAGAEKLYRRLVELSPADGYPALSRFLYLTQQTSAVKSLLSPESPLTAQPSVIRARTAIAAGQSTAALSALQAPENDPLQEYQRVILLANTLSQAGEKDKAKDALLEGVMSSRFAGVQRRDLFRLVLSMGGTDRLAEALPVLCHDLVLSSTLTYPELRMIAVDGLIALSSSSEYAAFHKKLEAQKGESGVHAWLYSLACIRKGDPDAALKALDAASGGPLPDKVKLIVFEELGSQLSSDTERALGLYKQLIPIAPDPDRIRLIAGRLCFKQQLFSEAAVILKPINPALLDEASHNSFSSLILTVVAKAQPLTDLIRTFEVETSGVPYARVRELSDSPFRLLPNTQFEELRALIQARLSEPGAPPELHILEMSLGNYLGDQSVIAQALGAYVTRRPLEMEAAQEFADLMAQQAYQAVSSDPNTSPSREKLKEVGDAAAKALWTALQNRPYVPENFAKLIELYRMLGDEEKAKKVTNYLTDATTATADDVHLAAYVLSTNGYPELSLPLYERALKMDASKARYRLNYAGALTRVQRFDDAEAIYRDIIVNGVNGRVFHPHEVLANSVRLADQNGYSAKHFDFLKSLISGKEKVAQHDQFLLDTGKTYLSLHQMDKAEPFFEALREQYPDHRDTAADLLIQTSVAKGDFISAETRIADEEKRSTDSAGLLALRLNLAEVKRIEGRLDDAVTIWTAVQKEFPKDRKAARALVTAAQALVDAGRMKKALELLNQYVAADVGDPDGETTARELMRNIANLNVPDAAILRSAMEESPTTAPATSAP